MKKRNQAGKKTSQPPRRKKCGADLYLLFTEKLLRRYRNRPGYEGFYRLVHLQAGRETSLPVGRAGATHFHVTHYYKYNFSYRAPGQIRAISVKGKDGVFRMERLKETIVAAAAPKAVYRDMVHEKIMKITETLQHRAASGFAATRGVFPQPAGGGEFGESVEETGFAGDKTPALAHQTGPTRVRDLLESGETGYVSRYARRKSGRPQERKRRPALIGLSLPENDDYHLPDREPRNISLSHRVNETAYRPDDVPLLSVHRNRKELSHRVEPKPHDETVAKEPPKTVSVRKETAESKEMIFEEIIKDDRKMKKIGNYFFEMFEEKMAREFERRGIL